MIWPPQIISQLNSVYISIPLPELTPGVNDHVNLKLDWLRVKQDAIERFIKRNENSMRSDSLAQKMMDPDVNGFWREIKVMNGCPYSSY